MHTQLTIEQPAHLFWEFEKNIQTSNPLIFFGGVILLVKINKIILCLLSTLASSYGFGLGKFSVRICVLPGRNNSNS